MHLANQFLVTIVEGKCLQFLMEKSKKPALFKYRVADKYGCTALKVISQKNLCRRVPAVPIEAVGENLKNLGSFTLPPSSLATPLTQQINFPVQEHVLDNLRVADFKMKLFKTNIADYNQLGPDAAETFMARYDALSPPREYDEEDE